MLIKIFPKPGFYLLILFFTGFSSYAQLPADENVIPDPLNKLQSFFYPSVKKPVKSFIYIIDKDTILKSNYDRNGNELSRFDYEGNKPLYKSLNKYNGDLKTETSFFVNNNLQTTTTYKYDGNKNLVEWKKMKTVYDKNTQTSKQVNEIHWFYEPDEKNKIKRKYSIDEAGIKLLSFEYMYDTAGKLNEVNELQWKNKYEYKNGLLTNQYRIFKNDNSVYASSEFTYNEDNLLTGSSDKYYSSAYSYDSGRLKKIRYTNKADNTWQEIEFYYNGSVLSKAGINATDPNFKPAFIFKSDYLYSYWSRNEVNKLRMEFLYDKYNNITEIKYFIKDVYKYSKLFIYKYY